MSLIPSVIATAVFALIAGCMSDPPIHYGWIGLFAGMSIWSAINALVRAEKEFGDE